MKHFSSALLILLLSSSCTNNSLKEENQKIASPALSAVTAFECNYSAFKRVSKLLYKEFTNDPDPIKKQRLVNNIRDSLFPCWYGTPWDFYGTTEEPNKGKIACGYFVTTLLRDMNIPVNRIKHAQCASEEMIKAVCKKNSISRHSNENNSTFIDEVAVSGPGLYIVGLDFHTGFILNDGNEIHFIHANYSGKKVVMSEAAKESSVLSASKYKVIGKVF
jgi:hypothetical protein